MVKINSPRIWKFTATTTVQKLLDQNHKRKAVLIVNNGAVIVELLSSQLQAYGDGIPIDAGASYSNEHFNPQGEYYVIAASATCDLRIEETLSSEG